MATLTERKTAEGAPTRARGGLARRALGPGRDGPGFGNGQGRGDGGGDGGLNPGGAFALPPLKIGVWLFLGVATILFSALTSAYLVRMGLADWRPLPEPRILWLNTLLLVLSSAALQIAWGAARRGLQRAMRQALLAGGLFAVLFGAGQLAAWQQLQALGYFVSTNPSSAFFYLITALHGLHVLGGLVAWGRTTRRAWQGLYGPRNHVGIELCTVYWHFLLIVWLAMFGLMLAT